MSNSLTNSFNHLDGGKPVQPYTIHNINGYDAERDAGECVYHPEIAERVCKFIETYCTHVEGALAGQPYILPDWQRAFVSNLYGWLRPDGTRRYREAFAYVPRKNSKTTLLAALALYGLTSDGETGAQVVSIAAEKEQAALCHRIMAAMIANSKALSSKLKVYRALKSIEFQKTNSIYKALSSEAGTKHGMNPSLCISDEIHAMPDRDLIDAIQTGMGARRQPLIVHITTADYWRPESPCNKLLDYAKKCRDGVIIDPSFLPALWYADNDDDWKSETVWRKANPNYGLSVRPEFLREHCLRAQNEPSYTNEFKRLHLNITTDARTAWLSLDLWDKCVTEFDAESLKGKRCFAGLDLSATTDLSAFSLYFPDSGHVLVWFWMPEDRAREREERDRVPYSTWADAGHVAMTPGNVIDYQFIRHKINELSKQYKIQSIGYDPWNATGLVQQLVEIDRLPLIEFRQGYQTMSPASKQFEVMLMSQNIKLPKHPILRWNASNCMIITDPTGSIKPTKQHSTGRIDGMIALLIASGLSASSPQSGSIYDTRGPLVF